MNANDVEVAVSFELASQNIPATLTPGERIAVYREVDGVGDIWLVDAGSGELVNLTEGQLTELIDIPSWRPDASSIAA